jgi:hypothetical protein
MKLNTSLEKAEEQDSFLEDDRGDPNGAAKNEMENKRFGGLGNVKSFIIIICP